MHGSGFNAERKTTRYKNDAGDKVELPPLGSNIEPSAKEKLLRYPEWNKSDWKSAHFFLQSIS